MEKFSKGLAVALMTCAAIGVSACKEKSKPEEKPAASAPAPASSVPTSQAASKPAQAAPSAVETKAAEAKPAAPAPAAPANKPKTVEEAKPAPAAETKTAEAKAAAPSSDAAKAAAPAAAAPAAAAPAAAPAPSATADTPAAGEDIKDRTSPPDPVSELAKQQGFKFEDGRYRNKDGDPQPVVTKDYMVDWGTWNGFRRYHDACHVCHGPNALGSTFAPTLADSLQTMDYGTFVATVSSGKRENKGGTEFVMPAFGTDKNIMCYLDDIYTYIKARSYNFGSQGKLGMPPGRPNGREDISDEAKKAADDCTGP